MRKAFEERLNTIYPLLAEVPGFEVIKPQGAFYLFPNVKKAMEIKGYTDVNDFTNAILEEAEVALVTGEAWAQLQGSIKPCEGAILFPYFTFTTSEYWITTQYTSWIVIGGREAPG